MLYAGNNNQDRIDSERKDAARQLIEKGVDRKEAFSLIQSIEYISQLPDNEAIWDAVQAAYAKKMEPVWAERRAEKKKLFKRRLASWKHAAKKRREALRGVEL